MVMLSKCFSGEHDFPVPAEATSWLVLQFCQNPSF